MIASDLVAKVKSLPPVSHTALRLANLLEHPAISNSEVVEVLKCDHVLTAKLLRACNSPYFGLENSVSSVDQAVFILGHQQILHIVLTLAFGSVMTPASPAYAAEARELRRHSLITAQAAETLADKIYAINVDPSVALTGGLLHDIGKLVFAQVLSAELQAAIGRLMKQDQIPRLKAERLVTGVDHAELGALLLENWHLPGEIVEAVASHHQPVLEPAPKLSSVVCLANTLAHTTSPFPARDDDSSDEVKIRVLQALDISTEQFEMMAISVRQSLDHVEYLMTMG